MDTWQQGMRTNNSISRGNSDGSLATWLRPAARQASPAWDRTQDFEIGRWPTIKKTDALCESLKNVGDYPVATNEFWNDALTTHSWHSLSRKSKLTFFNLRNVSCKFAISVFESWFLSAPFRCHRRTERPPQTNALHFSTFAQLREFLT